MDTIQTATNIDKTTVYIKADAGKRFVNLLIDVIAIIIGLSLLHKTVYHNFIFTFFTLVRVPEILLVFAYYYIFESLTGQTLGKMLTKTKVIMEDGSKPTSNALVVRSIVRFIPFEPILYIGGKWLHDSVSKTMVVESEPSTKI